MSELNNRDEGTIEFLLSRRSTVARMMDGPGPNDADLRNIMEAGMRVPDHGRLTPWRFIVIRGDARATIGNVIAASFKKDNPDAIDEQIEMVWEERPHWVDPTPGNWKGLRVKPPTRHQPRSE